MLPHSEDRMFLSTFVWIGYQRLYDRRTDRRTVGIAVAITALCIEFEQHRQLVSVSLLAMAWSNTLYILVNHRLVSWGTTFRWLIVLTTRCYTLLLLSKRKQKIFHEMKQEKIEGCILGVNRPPSMFHLSCAAPPLTGSYRAAVLQFCWPC